MSLTLRPGRRRSRRKILARAGEAKPRKTSGRSTGSITRKLRDILRPVRPPGFCISFSDSLIIPAHVGFALNHTAEAQMDVDAVRRRPTLTLDGLWDFEFEGPTTRLDGGGHTIRTPGIWQTQF